MGSDPPDEAVLSEGPAGRAGEVDDGALSDRVLRSGRPESVSGAHMARPEKVAVVDEIRTKLGDADAAILTEYRGLTVTELASLRGALRPAATEYKVFKNTLARRGREEAGLTELAELLQGPTAIAFVRGDAVAAAKALRDFGRTSPGAGGEGRPARRRGAHPGRHRGARRHRAPRGAAGPAGRWVPGPARQGGRAVPGVHPQPRLRRQGADRPARRRRRGLAGAASRGRGPDRAEAPAAEAAAPADGRRRGAGGRDARRAERRVRSHRGRGARRVRAPSPSNSKRNGRYRPWQP